MLQEEYDRLESAWRRVYGHEPGSDEAATMFGATITYRDIPGSWRSGQYVTTAYGLIVRNLPDNFADVIPVTSLRFPDLSTHGGSLGFVFPLVSVQSTRTRGKFERCWDVIRDVVTEPMFDVDTDDDLHAMRDAAMLFGEFIDQRGRSSESVIPLDRDQVLGAIRSVCANGWNPTIANVITEIDRHAPCPKDRQFRERLKSLFPEVRGSWQDIRRLT